MRMTVGCTCARLTADVSLDDQILYRHRRANGIKPMKPIDSQCGLTIEQVRRCVHTAVLYVVMGVALCGCAPMAITAFGVGAATGVQHTLGGVAYKTFTAPLPEIRKAVVVTLRRMDITVGSTQKIELGESITARAADRDIEVQLESISSNTTRMRTSVRSGLLMDSATATEIIIQTERTLNRN
jgi:hypothetical protein